MSVYEALSTQARMLLEALAAEQKKHPMPAIIWPATSSGPGGKVFDVPDLSRQVKPAHYHRRLDVASQPFVNTPEIWSWCLGRDCGKLAVASSRQQELGV
jgi:hypothetical protein